MTGIQIMADYYTNLVTTRDNIAVQLADMTASPKPSYRIDGQQVDWDKHFKTLSMELNRLNQEIQAAEPFEVQTRGYTG